MADQDATLRDAMAAVTTDTVAAATTETKTDTSNTVATVDTTADKTAAELGQFLLDSGFTPEQARDLPEAAKALAAMSSVIETNPIEFLNMLERTNPEAAKKFHWKMAESFADRYETKGAEGKDGKNGEAKTDPALAAQIADLTEKVNRADQREAERQQAIMLAGVESRYNARVDDLMGIDAVKGLNLTKSETKALKAQLSTELSSDPATRKRVSNGNFVDVPRTFKALVEDWARDRKEASEASVKSREKQQERSFGEFSTGPGVVSQNDVQKSLEGASDDWSATEREFAAALSRA